MGEIWEIKLTEGSVRWLWMLALVGGVRWWWAATQDLECQKWWLFRLEWREGCACGREQRLSTSVASPAVSGCWRWRTVAERKGGQTPRRGFENVERDVKCFWHCSCHNLIGAQVTFNNFYKKFEKYYFFHI